MKRLTVLVILTCLPRVSAAAAFDRVVVFGDSYSDEGNYATGAGYYMGRFSNGPVWVEDLAPRIQLPTPVRSSAGGANATNFAYGGAVVDGASVNGVPSLSGQISLFLSRNTPAQPDLFI